MTLNEESLIPQQQYFNTKVQITTNDVPETAGTYSISNKLDFIENISFNYKRDESQLQYQDFSGIKHMKLSHSLPDLISELKSDSKIKDRKSTRLNSSHVRISYAVFCLKKKK